MSQSQTKIRRTPKIPFFIGNLILIFFAVYLVFWGPEPWSMSTVLLVVLCVFTGGLISIVPFVLDQWVVANVNRMRALQVGMNLRAALDRSEKVLERLEDIQREDSPVRLVAERLPELVESKLLEAQDKADSDATKHREIIRNQLEDLSKTTATLESQQNILESIAAHYATREYLETGITRIREDMHKLSVQVAELQRIYTTTRPPVAPERKVDDTPTASKERNEQPSKQASEEKGEPGPKPAPASQASTAGTSQNVADGKAANSGPEKQTSDPEGKEKTTTKAKESVLTVSSFIGIQNKIYLRGNGPGLSEDKGVLLQVTGIGEWQWRGDLSEAMECELFLNDVKAAREGKIILQPGEKKTVQPSFG